MALTNAERQAAWRKRRAEVPAEAAPIIAEINRLLEEPRIKRQEIAAQLTRLKAVLGIE